MGKKKGIWGILLGLSFSIALAQPVMGVRAAQIPDGNSLAAESEKQMPSETAGQSLKDVRKAKTAAGKWEKSGKRWRFKRKDGTYAADAWQKIKGKIYYFNHKGYRISGWFDYQGRRYYLDKNGIMQTGWKKYRKSYYYLNQKGVMAARKWIRHRGNDYYLKSDGKMATGWLKIGKKRYYLGADGARVTGMQFIGGKWYYFNKNGTYNARKKVPTVNPNKPMVALTFDDGPSAYTDRLLRCLQKNDVKATFFLVGSSAGRYPDTIRKAYRMGCEIGNHTYSHPSLSSLSAQGIQDQVNSVNRLVREITGKNPTLLRPPYGDYNSNVCANAGLPVILWSVDTRDWATRNADSIVSHIQTHVSDGDIILMHDTYAQSVDAAEMIIPWLKSKGYQMVTVSELAKYKGQRLYSGGSWRKFT